MNKFKLPKFSTGDMPELVGATMPTYPQASAIYKFTQERTTALKAELRCNQHLKTLRPYPSFEIRMPAHPFWFAWERQTNSRL